MTVPVFLLLDNQNAYSKIKEESELSPGRETGGILVGRMFEASAGLVLVVVAASGPGRHADRRPHTYAPDVLARQQYLDHWCDRYTTYAVGYIGEWHKHPPGNRQPSAGDTRQVQSIFAEPSYILPHGIYTPIVTIENGEFHLNHYYYARKPSLQLIRPERIKEVQIMETQQDTEQMLRKLADIEQEYHSAKQRSKSSSGTWNSFDSSDEPSREPPNLEEMRPDLVSSTSTIIDAKHFISPHPESSSSSDDTIYDVMDVPPFPSALPVDQIPEGPPLPKRQSREQTEIKRFCLAKRLPLKEISHPDGRHTFEVQIVSPIPVDVSLLSRPVSYETAEGVVEPEPLGDENGIVLVHFITIDTDQTEDPSQMPSAWLTLTNEQRLNVDVRKMFTGKMHTRISPKDILQETLEALQQPKPFKNIPEWIEHQGRIIIRQVEVASRNVADKLADVNEGYTFRNSADVFYADQNDPEME